MMALPLAACGRSRAVPDASGACRCSRRFANVARMNSGGAGKAWVVVLAVLIAPGCSTYAVSRYAVSAPNVAALRMLRGHPINVGAFSAAEEVSKIDCRAVGPIKTPDAESFTEYVRAALISELEMAEVYSVTAPVTLTGTLDQIDFHPYRGNGTLASPLCLPTASAFALTRRTVLRRAISARQPATRPLKHSCRVCKT